VDFTWIIQTQTEHVAADNHSAELGHR